MRLWLNMSRAGGGSSLRDKDQFIPLRRKKKELRKSRRTVAEKHEILRPYEKWRSGQKGILADRAFADTGCQTGSGV